MLFISSHWKFTCFKWTTEFCLPDDDACGCNDDEVRSLWRVTLGDGWVSSSDEPWLLNDACLLSDCCRCCK